jgi:hypothetical protein
MSYDPDGLSALTYAKGFTLWHYKSEDRAYDVTLPGYFDPAASMLRVGDFVLLNANRSGPVESGVLLVSVNVGGHVKVAAMTQIIAGDGIPVPVAA